jgi:hypothetical protein
MREVEGAVLELDESVRAVAFSMMEAYVLSGRLSAPASRAEAINPTEPGSLGDFFESRDVSKPAQAVMEITAYLFQEFGSEPFTPQHIRDIADEVGLTVPQRIDMTLKSAKKDGKPIFRSVGRGKYAPTVFGEATLKTDHNVTKGRRKRAATGEEEE